MVTSQLLQSINWCQDKIPNAKIPNVTKYPKYTQYFILTLKLSQRLFSIIFS